MTRMLLTAWAAALRGLLSLLALGALVSLGAEPETLRAQLIPSQQATLSSELTARLAELPLDEGEYFHRGQRVALFDCELQEAQFEKAQATLDGATSDWKGHQRLSELNAIGQMELRASEAELRKAKAEVAYLQVVLKKCELLAPFEGRVAKKHVHGEEFVQAGEPLLDLVGSGELLAEFILPSSLLSTLPLGARLVLFIEDTQQTYPLSLTRFSARVDPVSQTIKALGKLEGSFPELLPGMSGYLELGQGDLPSSKGGG